MNILRPDDILSFGKNGGLSLAEVFQYQPSYIEWAIINIDDFKIDMQSFENLPPPTTIGYKKNRFEKSGLDDLEKFNENANIKVKEDFEGFVADYFRLNDVFNPRLSVSEIKEMINEGSSFNELKDYKFPDYVRKVNNDKSDSIEVLP